MQSVRSGHVHAAGVLSSAAGRRRQCRASFQSTVGSLRLVDAPAPLRDMSPAAMTRRERCGTSLSPIVSAIRRDARRPMSACPTRSYCDPPHTRHRHCSLPNTCHSPPSSPRLAIASQRVSAPDNPRTEWQLRWAVRVSASRRASQPSVPIVSAVSSARTMCGTWRSKTTLKDQQRTLKDSLSSAPVMPRLPSAGVLLSLDVPGSLERTQLPLTCTAATPFYNTSNSPPAGYHLLLLSSNVSLTSTESCKRVFVHGTTALRTETHRELDPYPRADRRA